MRNALVLLAFSLAAVPALGQETASDDLIFPDETYLGLSLHDAVDLAVDRGWTFVGTDNSDPTISLAMTSKREGSGRPTHMVFAAAREQRVESVMIFTSLPLDLYLTQLTKKWGAPSVRDLQERFDAGFQWAADEGRTVIHLAEAAVPDDPDGRTLTAVNLSRPQLPQEREAR